MVARNTWRMVWRDPVIWIEWGLLLVLAGMAAIAAVGSPTAADGSVEMWGVVYSVAPFAMVLVIGQILRADASEYFWQMGNLSRTAYSLGRVAGLFAVGSAVVLGTSLVGGAAMAFFGQYPYGSSMYWNGLWAVVLALPTLLAVIALFWSIGQLFFRQGRGYYSVGLALALGIAFAEYKLPYLQTFWPHLNFWNPFLGFLALGLTLPPRLLGDSAIVPFWVIWNRVGTVVFALLLLSFSVMRPRSTARRYVLAYSRRWKILLEWGVVIGVAGVFGYLALLSRVSPPVMQSYTVMPAPPGAAVVAHGVLRVGGTAGKIQGTLALAAQPVNSASTRLVFALNAGLSITQVTSRGRQLSYHVL
ncbi:MAG: hypothetical protein OWS74_02040, partial [Firmicutes bacterium]|nr:hypothetical protein [Bacillota bacterium]